MHFRDSYDVIAGPWRAVLVLGITQTLGWGTIFYPVVLTAPLIAADRGWSVAFAMAGFSAGLFVQGIVSRKVGALIDRFGGHSVMPIGSLMGAAGLSALAYTYSAPTYFATWAFIGVAMSASLHDTAVASIGRIFGAAARRPITMLSIIGGFASAISWAATHFLLRAVGWQGTYLVYAAVLAFVAAPMHRWALPRSKANPTVSPRDAQARSVSERPPAKGKPFLLIATGFAAWIFVPTGLFPNLLAMFERFGLDAGTAVAIGTLIGPSGVGARILEMLAGRDIDPLYLVRGVLSLLLCSFILVGVLGVSAPVAVVFAVTFGIANGLMLIARGTLPLAMFGPSGYGYLIGRIITPMLIIQAGAPFVVAVVADKLSDAVALSAVAAFAAVSLACFCVMRNRAT